MTVDLSGIQNTAQRHGRRAAPYGFVSEGVSVGSEQGGLRPQEGPRHAAPRGRGLLLELAFQGGHLVSGVGVRGGKEEREEKKNIKGGNVR